MAPDFGARVTAAIATGLANGLRELEIERQAEAWRRFRIRQRLERRLAAGDWCETARGRCRLRPGHGGRHRFGGRA